MSPVEGENIPERDMDHGSPDTVPLQQIDRPVPLRPRRVRCALTLDRPPIIRHGPRETGRGTRV